MMRQISPIFLLLLSLLSSSAQATPRWDYSLDNTVVDNLGLVGDLTNNGPVPFVSSPAPCTGTKWAGTHSNTAYFTTPSNANTVLAALSAYRITIKCAYFNTLVNPCMWRTSDGNTFFQVLATGQLRFCSGDIGHVIGSGLSAVTTGVNYKFSIEVIGSTRTLYINDVSVATDNFGTVLATFTSQTLGKYTGSEAVDGYMAGFALDDTTPTGTYTSTATPTWTRTITQTFTHTATSTVTPTFTNSFTFSPSPTVTPTSTISPVCQIVHDADASTISYETDFTFPFTNSASENGVLVVGVGAYGPEPEVTAVTYNGVQLTPIDQETGYGDMLDVSVSLWYLLNPSVGTFDIEVMQGNGQFVAAGASSYSGVGSVGSDWTSSNNDIGLGITGITTAGNYSVLAAIVAQDQQAIISLGSGLTMRWDNTAGVGMQAVTGDQNDLFAALAGTAYSLSYGFSALGNNVGLAAELIPYCYYTASITPSVTVTITSSITTTNTTVYTPTFTPTATLTFSASPTFTKTVTPTPTSTPRATPTPGGDLMYYCGTSGEAILDQTDLWTLAPGGGRLDEIQEITITASNDPGIQPRWQLIRRSTLDTGSANTTWTVTPKDIDQGASTTTVLTWQSSPDSLGTEESVVRQTIATCSNPSAATCLVTWDFSPGELIVHPGEQLIITTGGVAVQGMAVNSRHTERAE